MEDSRNDSDTFSFLGLSGVMKSHVILLHLVQGRNYPLFSVSTLGIVPAP